MIETLFSRAASLASDKRAALLAEECGSDRALREQVEAMLAEHDRDSGLLDTPLAWRPGVTEEPAEEMPALIGPYRILRAIGRGGMGQVYLAEREAPGFRQQVALKILRRGLDTDDLIARFRNERQILASLNHANIARLLDVGATEQGLPYFVMEYIDGVPILEFCDRGRLSVTERLRLFQTVCGAVHYAHRSLIVHRDLKPGNILVTAEGAPKLLDFGIAKILGTGASDDATQLTRPDVRVLTPAYSAPEQLRGEPITTACDVYALGLLLHVLLTGRHPYAEPDTTPAQLERLALEVDPPPPSTQIAPGSATAAAAGEARGVPAPVLRRQLEGDLDTIVLKAIRKEPEARYPSALSLAEDLDRHMAGLPVHARPATARYRIRKFIRRNRAPVSGAAAVFVILSGLTTVTLYQSERVRQESARVARERDKALEVRSFLLEMFGAGGPDQQTGETVTARQLLDRRAATLTGAWTDDPEMQAEMMTVLAEGYERLRLFEQAEPLARQALEIRMARIGRAHPDVIVSLNVLGWLRRERNDLEEADSLLREAVSLGRQVFPEEGDPRLARALNDLGTVRHARGEYAEAVQFYRESLGMRRQLLGEEHIGVAITSSNLAVSLNNMGDLDGALHEAQAALDLFRRILGPDHQRTVTARTNLATYQGASGDREGAVVQRREILERNRRVFGPRHATVALSMTMLANDLRGLGQSAEAESLLEEALAIQREAEGTRPEEHAWTLRTRGMVRAFSSRPELALEDYAAALDIHGYARGAANAEIGLLLRLRGDAHAHTGRLTDAEHNHREAVRVFDQVLGARHSQTIDARLNLSEVLVRLQRGEEALDLLAEVERTLDANGAAADHSSRQRVARVRAAAS